MDKNKIDNLFREFFDLERIYSEIRHKKRGVLYTAIHLSEENSSQVQEICDYFEIKQNSNITEDFGISYDNLPGFYINILRKNFHRNDFLGVEIDIDEFIPKLERPAFIKFCSKLEDDKKMEVIAFTAFILFSTYAIVRWQSSKKNPPSNQLQNNKNTALLPNPSISTAICLAVPASAIYHLNEQQIINRSQIIKLIDAASNFLCLEITEAEGMSIEIDRNKEPLPDSKLKFYLRIDIPDGQKIIGQKTKYVIKRDIPNNSSGTIRDLGRLGSISSIKSFNRV